MSIRKGHAGKFTIGLIMIPRQRNPLGAAGTYEELGHTAIIARRAGKVVLVRGWIPAVAFDIRSSATVPGTWNQDMAMVDHKDAESFEFEVDAASVDALVAFFKNDASKTKWAYHCLGKSSANEGTKPKNCVQSAIHVLRHEIGHPEITIPMATLRDTIKQRTATNNTGFLQEIALDEARTEFGGRRLTN